MAHFFLTHKNTIPYLLHLLGWCCDISSDGATTDVGQAARREEHKMCGTNRIIVIAIVVVVVVVTSVLQLTQELSLEHGSCIVLWLPHRRL